MHGLLATCMSILTCLHVFMLWFTAIVQVKSGTIFDNILITDSEEYAEEFGNDTWGQTKDAEKKMKEKVSTEI